MKKLQSTVAELKQRGEHLASKRNTAQAEFDAAQAARQAFMLQGDLDDENTGAKLQARVDTAASALQGFADAITTLSAQVAEAERVLADEQQRVERKAASESLALDVATIEAQILPWLSATRGLAGNMEKLAGLRFGFEAGSIGRYLSNAAGEVEIAAAVALPDLHRYVSEIAAGREAIPRAPQPVPVVLQPPPPKTETLFFLRAAKYRDGDGNSRLISKNTDAALPPEVAARALKLGAGVPLSDPRRKKFGTQSQALPDESWCLDLDQNPADATSAAEPVMRSVFTKLDRGPAYLIRAPRGHEPEPMAAARSVGDMEER